MDRGGGRRAFAKAILLHFRVHRPLFAAERSSAGGVANVKQQAPACGAVAPPPQLEPSDGYVWPFRYYLQVLSFELGVGLTKEALNM